MRWSEYLQQGNYFCNDTHKIWVLYNSNGKKVGYRVRDIKAKTLINYDTSFKLRDLGDPQDFVSAAMEGTVVDESTLKPS